MKNKNDFFTKKVELLSALNDDDNDDNIKNRLNLKHIQVWVIKFWGKELEYIVIIIIIMSRYQHGYFWPSLATPTCSPLLLAGPQSYIPYRHRATVCRFEVDVLPLLVHVKGSTGVHHLRARPYSPRNASMFNSSNFDSFRDGWKVAVQLLCCGVLSPGLVQYCSHDPHSNHLNKYIIFWFLLLSFTLINLEKYYIITFKFCFVVFYGTSNIVGYLIPDPFL